MKTHKRTFGQYSVEVRGDRVAIVGDWNSNFGSFYEANFERFKAFEEDSGNDWNRPQVLGMDWGYGLTATVRTWLYNLVLNDKIES